ncbi:unnamed protein product [Didymodactylos carnosus]|uniref:FAD-binding PCMH-type domain-containing protein n=1 Tax=Didymodactylos carnosus TaxID=1234261 RepID=A0A814JVS9_9BILA|nr:unnamed protein product [Didymodactylos carnosus]CAF1044354.1 unnamed protein product [Didymodactylos carnosus]CAF3757108.1 unnamed protein product [Didymodactylos carnosus]CAF3814389.1 unnamed protein product [Didymodactylos carnosus]
MWRSYQVGGMQYFNWENVSCSISNGNSSCNQGSVPVIGVNATWPEHVQATIRYAATNNLRLVIKTTGHDLFGRSTAAGSLLLWLHYMKNMTLIEDYSSCGAASVPNVVRLGAGIQWGEAYEWLAKYNLTVIGGNCNSVSAAGGYLQGGGHSPLSRWKGMAVDQVLEYDVVLANGERQTVSACQNSDLFWALSGGGGGTYAIVLSVVLRTFPMPYVIGTLHNIHAPNEVRYATLIQEFFRMLPSLADAGWAGYVSMVDTTISITYLWPNGNLEVANATFTKFVNNNTDLIFSTSGTIFLPSFYDGYKLVFETSNPTGYNNLMSSRLIPETIVRTRSDDVAQVFLRIKGQSNKPSSLLVNLVAGGQVSNNINNSVNPAWRTALLHVFYGQAWADGLSIDDQNMIAEHVTSQMKILDSLLNGSQFGSYMNEADPNEPKWQQRFFGSQAVYDRLKAIKNNVDPQGLFVCKSCVGSEDWTSDLNCPNTAAISTTLSSTTISASIKFSLAWSFVFLLLY